VKEHVLFHQCAASVIALVAKGDREGAAKAIEFRSEYMRLSTNVGGLISALRSRGVS
jgi:hypothetical protein